MKKVISFLIAVIMVIGVVPAIHAEESTVDLTYGLIAYYNFDYDSKTPSTIIDQSGNGNDATVLNTVVAGDGGWNPGANNQLTVADGAAIFPGMTNPTPWSTYNGAALKLPNNFNKDVSSFTFSAWINADGSYTYANKLTRFFDFGNLGSGSNNAYNSIFTRYTSSSGLLRIQDREINKYTETTLSTMPFTDAWGLFTFVYEYNEETSFYETKVYINGEEEKAFSTTDVYTRGFSDLGELDDSSNGLFIGRTVWAATNQQTTENPDFKGKMDEIRIYNRGLTASEVKELYNTTSPVGSIVMESFEAEDVTTLAGDYPLLPETVTVIYNTGTIKTEKVTWDFIPSDRYAHTGVIKVNGITETGNAVSVNVTVIKKDTSTLNQGLVAYYNFDGDSEQPATITDMSGNNNNATVHNLYKEVSSRWGTYVVQANMTVTDGVLYFPGAMIGSDAGIPGNSQKNTFYPGPAIKMPDGINQNIEEFTYSAWIYADTDYRYSSSLQRFFDFGTDERNSIFYRYVPATGESRFQDRGIGASSDDANSLMSATLEDNPFADKWAHLVVTYKKSDLGEYYTPHIYINGVERYEYDNSLTTLTRALSDLGTSTNQNYGFWIGKTQWAANSSEAANNPEFKGKMDEIRLYDRALSESEIAELYTTKKPSDMPVDYDSMSKTTIPLDEDVELSGKYPSTNMNGETQMLVSSNNGAAYTRYGLMRRSEFTAGEITAMENCEKAVLSVYVTLVDNWGEDEYYCYGLTGESNSWNAHEITYDNYSEYLGGSISNVGVFDNGEVIDTQKASGGENNFYMQWDVTEFVRENASTGFSFLLTCGSDVMYLYTSESNQENMMPELIIYQQGTPITISRVDTEGNQISTSLVYGVEGNSYTYSVADALVSYNNSIYVVNKDLSNLTIDSVTGEDVIEVVYEKAENVTCEDVNVRTYVGKAPTLPRVLNITSGSYSALFPVQWSSIDASDYSEKGQFFPTGIVLGTDIEVKATVTVFPEYNGQVGGDLTITIFVDGNYSETINVKGSYGSTFTLSESYETYLGNMYVLQNISGNASAIGDSVVMNELNQNIELSYVTKETIEADLNVKIRADNWENTSYTMTATANVLNTKLNDETVKLVIADYNDNGELINTVTESAVILSRTGEAVTIEKSISYDEAKHKNSIVYLWTDALQPIVQTVKICDVKLSGYLPDEVIEMMPTYDSAVETLKKANSFWQGYQSYDNWYGGAHPAFWDKAAYHTGNMEYFKLTGDTSYLQYSIDWANYNNWKGNDSTADPSTWTWGYNQTQGSNAVLFGDWQICFQTYIDLYNFNKDGLISIENATLDRVFEVMDYQISKDEDGFWWWADALYMVMPVMTKLYKQTGDEKYLDALYKYFRYAKELMYDGPGGIPTSAEGYTTSAALKSGASYSDPDDYKFLFFRDAGYVYPLNPNTGHENEKNFWARGNGWVFAGLSKVLSDMPESYAHYDEFYTTYMEMAKAIISCQEVDDNGYGFWTQSMLQDYPKGSNGNDEGYETSGTGFFTYGLFWGINNGLLDEETYLEPALRAWGYLENVALLDNGMVGYVQPIGSNATQATPAGTTVNFGVGAFLLAGCEAARWGENNEK